jgi:arginyl-tRNA synthetase
MPMQEPPKNIFATILDRVQSATVALLGSGYDHSRIVVEPTREAAHGDMATNAAMVLAKEARQ